MSSIENPDWLQTIHHDGSEKYVSNPCPDLGDSVKIRLRVGPNATVKDVYIRTFPDGEQVFTAMTSLSSELPCRWWEGEVEISQPDVHYRFLLVAEEGLWWYTAAGHADYIPLDNTDFRLLASYGTPSWLETAVFYQIFPDRFANANPDINPQPAEFDYQGFGPQTYPWGTRPASDQPFPIVFYGGDLPGISQHLDYLDRLGINALYLNPIFTANSNHKYDVTDYEKVDPHLGGDDALIDLRQALNERGMTYILDIVPNHCGYWHPWFQEAQSDPQAPEVDFFTFHQHPDKYASWLGVWTLPKLNYRSAELRRRIYESDDSVFRKWLLPPFSADGWRVDVANMLGRQGETQVGAEIVSGIREAVKSLQPDAYLIGENFFDASPQLQGDQWDAVMNYSGFTLPLWYWLDNYKEWAHDLGRFVKSPGVWSTEALVNTWQSRRAAIPWAIALQQFNLLDSHDTPRIRSIVKNNDALVRLAAIIQFTFPGVPCIYYGDEIGMADDPDLESRGCMIWNQDLWDHRLLDFYQELIRFRKKSPSLKSGGFQMLVVEEDTFAYQRESMTERILVVAHRSSIPRDEKPLPIAHGGIADGRRFRELFSGQELVVSEGSLPLPPHPQGATLWIETD